MTTHTVQSKPDVVNNKQKGGFLTFIKGKKPIYFLLVISLLVMGVLHLRSLMQHKTLVHENQVRIETMRAETQSFINAKYKELLLLQMKGFTWAVRGELTRDNLDQIGQYINQYVKEEEVLEIQLIDPKGKVLIASDKNKEGGYYDRKSFGEKPLTLDKTIYVPGDDGRITLFSPVMGLDNRLATIMMVYMPDYSMSIENKMESGSEPAPGKEVSVEPATQPQSKTEKEHEKPDSVVRKKKEEKDDSIRRMNQHLRPADDQVVPPTRDVH